MGISSLVGAGISGAASLFGAGQVADGASKASQAQAIASGNAVNLYNGAQGTNTTALSPYTNTGSEAVQTLGDNLSTLAGSSTVPTARYVNPSNTLTDATGYMTDPSSTRTDASQYQVDASPYATKAATVDASPTRQKPRRSTPRRT